MNRFAVPALLAAAALIWGCSGPPKVYVVKGAELLDNPEANEDVTFDVIAYPLTEDELAFFLDSMPRVIEAVTDRKATWQAIQTAENPVQAIRRHRAWRDAEVSCEDFMAVFIKANFIYEYRLEPVSMEDAKANLATFEAKVRLGKADRELRLATQSLKFMTDVVEAYERSGAFALYEKNQAAIDEAVEGLKSIGEG